MEWVEWKPKYQLMVENIANPEEVDGLRAMEKEVEAKGPPAKEKFSLSEWRNAREEECREEMKQYSLNTVAVGERAVSQIFSLDGFLEQSMGQFQKEILKVTVPVVKLAYLPLIQEAAEAVLFARGMAEFNQPLIDIRAKIQELERKVPESFSPEKINISKTFPFDRCRQTSDGKYYDGWLTTALKAKPIFFDQPDYVEKLKLFFRTVYLPGCREEEQQREHARKEAELKKAESPPAPPSSQSGGQYEMPVDELRELHETRLDSVPQGGRYWNRRR